MAQRTYNYNHTRTRDFDKKLIVVDDDAAATMMSRYSRTHTHRVLVPQSQKSLSALFTINILHDVEMTSEIHATEYTITICPFCHQ